LTEGSSSDLSGARRLPPEALREALRRDTRPVRPLLPPAVRMLIVLLVAFGAAAILISLAGLRPDRDMLDPRLLWIPAMVRVLAGVVLILLALREGVPGSGVPGVLRYGSLLGAPILLTLLTEWVALRAGGTTVPGLWTQMKNSLGCYPREVLLAIPALFAIAWLLARAYPLRPVFAATAGATGAGLVADAVLHLTCPVTTLSHTLLVHGGAVVSVAAVAALIGWLAARRRFAGA
jgi:hypothetical protein